MTRGWLVRLSRHCRYFDCVHWHSYWNFPVAAPHKPRLHPVVPVPVPPQREHQTARRLLVQEGCREPLGVGTRHGHLDLDPEVPVLVCHPSQGIERTCHQVVRPHECWECRQWSFHSFDSHHSRSCCQTLVAGHQRLHRDRQTSQLEEVMEANKPRDLQLRTILEQKQDGCGTLSSTYGRFSKADNRLKRKVNPIMGKQNCFPKKLAATKSKNLFQPSTTCEWYKFIPTWCPRLSNRKASWPLMGWQSLVRSTSGKLKPEKKMSPHIKHTSYLKIPRNFPLNCSVHPHFICRILATAFKVGLW